MFNGNDDHSKPLQYSFVINTHSYSASMCSTFSILQSYKILPKDTLVYSIGVTGVQPQHTFGIKRITTMWMFDSKDWSRRDSAVNQGQSLFGESGHTRPWRRRRPIFFTSSMPRALSTVHSCWQRSDSCRKMFFLSFIRAQMTNGNPNRCLYRSLSRAMLEASADSSASSPAPACSSSDSFVRVPLWRSLPARSGWHLRMPSLPGHTWGLIIALDCSYVYLTHRIEAICMHECPSKEPPNTIMTKYDQTVGVCLTWLWQIIDELTERSLQSRQARKGTTGPHCSGYHGTFFHHVTKNIPKILIRQSVHCVHVHVHAGVWVLSGCTGSLWTPPRSIHWWSSKTAWLGLIIYLSFHVNTGHSAIKWQRNGKTTVNAFFNFILWSMSHALIWRRVDLWPM